MNEKIPDTVTLTSTDHPTSDDPYQSFTLPARYYLDPEIFEAEKHRIFYKNWHYITHESSLKKTGDYASTKIGDEHVFVIRGDDGELRAFYNVCKHRAHHLVEGTGSTRSIVCPYHAWCYNLDGSLFNAPNTQDLPTFDKQNFGLTPVQLDVLCGLVLVNLDSSAQSIDQSAPGLREDLKANVPWLAGGEIVRDCTFGDAAMAANWKVVVDNNIECYHCQVSHPAFADMISMHDYEQDSHRNWARQLGPKTKADNIAYPFPDDGAVPRAMFWYLWPTLTINVLPGYRLANVLTINPVDAQRTTFGGQAISAHDGEIPERVYEYVYEELGTEDQELCESVQRGLRSQSYNQGPFVVDANKTGVSEHTVHAFHKNVIDALK